MSRNILDQITILQKRVRDLGLSKGIKDCHRATLWLVSQKLEEMAQEYATPKADFIKRGGIDQSLPAGDR